MGDYSGTNSVRQSQELATEVPASVEDIEELILRHLIVVGTCEEAHWGKLIDSLRINLFFFFVWVCMIVVV